MEDTWGLSIMTNNRRSIKDSAVSIYVRKGSIILELQTELQNRFTQDIEVYRTITNY